MPGHQVLEEENAHSFKLNPSSNDKHIISDMAANRKFKVYTIEDIAKLLQTPDSSSHLLAAQAALNLLPKVSSKLIDPLLQDELIPRFINFLSHTNNASLQHVACCVLANLTSISKEQGDVIVKAGAVPYLIHLLGSTCSSTKEHAILALANIAGGDANFNSLVKQYNILSLLLSLINTNRPVSFLRKLSCSLQILCKQPSNVEECPASLFSSLYQLFHYSDQFVVENICWAFAHLSATSLNLAEEVIKLGVTPRIAELLQSPHTAIVKGSLRTLGNLVEASQGQVVLDCGALPSFHHLLSKSTSTEIQKEAISILSNISSGSQDQKQRVIEAGLIEPMLELLEKGNHQLQYVIFQALASMCSGCSSDQSLYLVHAGILSALCVRLRSKESALVLLSLEALQELLEVCEECEVLCQMIEDLGALDIIEALQHHSDISIYKVASTILKKFFFCTETSSKSSHPSLDECGNKAPDNPN